MPKRIHIPFILISAVFLFSCSSTREKVSPEWSESMFFKNAQEAMDESRYETALYYYEVYLVRYPENHARVIAAEYERAFIQYKQREYSAASDGFEEIIRKYDESPYAMLYHPRFRYLSEIALENVAKKKAVDRRLLWRMKEENWAEENGEDLIDDGLDG